MQRLGLIAGAVLLLGVCGCSDRRIDQLEARLNADLADIRAVQAEQSAALSQMRNELRTVSGGVEELQHLSVGKTRELEKKLLNLGTRVPPPPGVPENLLQQDEEKISSLTGTAAEKFKAALAQIRSGDFEAAEKKMAEFVAENPGTAFTDNALFWLGICFTRQGQYDRAIVSFIDVFQSYPAEDMVAPALFQLAEVFQKTGAKDDAIKTLKKLIDEHPKSSLVSRARTRLSELEGKGGGVKPKRR